MWYVWAEELKSHYFRALISQICFFTWNDHMLSTKIEAQMFVCVCVCVPGGGAGGTAGAPHRYWWDWWGAQSVSGGAEGAAQGQRPGESQHVTVFFKQTQISLYIDDEDPAETENDE